MNLIVVVAKNWAIGCNNQLLFSLPEDMKNFRRISAGKTLVMGRKTLESFPGGKPLPKRINLVITKNPSYTNDDVIICHTLEDVFEKIKDLPPDDVLIIGGAEIYTQFLSYCQKAYITHVDTAVADADTFFPDLSKDNHWKLISQSEEKFQNDWIFRFCVYENQSPNNGSALRASTSSAGG